MAIVNFTQTLKLDPNNYEAYFQRAQMYEKVSLYFQRAQMYEKVRSFSVRRCTKG